MGIAVGIGLGLTSLSTQAALLADTYGRRRGVAMGIAFSGSMAAFVLGPVTQRIIDGFGWRLAFGCYAAADRADGAGLPEFITREFREFLTCEVVLQFEFMA